MYSVSSRCVNDFFIMEASTCGPERSLLSFILQNLAYNSLEAPLAVQYEILGSGIFQRICCVRFVSGQIPPCSFLSPVECSKHQPFTTLGASVPKVRCERLRPQRSKRFAVRFSRHLRRRSCHDGMMMSC